MKITSVVGREVYNSQGWPTIQCEIELDSQVWVAACAPSSCEQEIEGRRGYVPLYDGGSRLWGRGVTRAVEHIDYILAPALIGRYPDAADLDLVISELDGTADKSRLGVNTLNAVSMALYRAQAHAEGIELFELIAHYFDVEHVTFPFPQITLLHGGVRSRGIPLIQDFMVVPIGLHQFRAATELASALFHEMRALLIRKKHSTETSDFGGFIPSMGIEEALLCICDVMERTRSESDIRAVIGLDIAASHVYDAATGLYQIQGEAITGAALVDWYAKMITIFPIYSLEDPFYYEDWTSWKSLAHQVGERLQLVGDQLTMSNRVRITRAAEERNVTAVTVRQSLMGTVTETLDLIKYCKQQGLNVIIAHGAGETCDPFIADLAVGSSAGQIKLGGFCHGELMNKYNRLLAIEDALLWRMMR